MSIDIVERLQAAKDPSVMLPTHPPQSRSDALCAEAAAEITRLRDELAKAVPAGYVVVPKEPTEAMKSAGAFHCIQHAGAAGAHELGQAARIYRAMIDAASASRSTLGG